MAANGRLNIDIDKVELPEERSLSQVSLRLEKTGAFLRMPFLRFRTGEGGQGEATATAQVENMRLTAADADVTLRYATLDVQRLLGLIASLTTPTDSVPRALSLARATRRATRRAQRQQAMADPSMLSNGVLSAVLRVEADEVRYAAIKGTRFRLVSRLLEGEARLDDCSLEALQGHISLRGLMVSTPDREHHATQAQVQLQDIQLSDLFATATAMGLNVLGGDNIRGTLRGVVDLRTDLGPTFLPSLPRTVGYLKTDFRNLELMNVEALMEALKFMKAERTSHLFFEPVSSDFVLADGRLLIPGLRLNSNLSSLQVSGHYGLDGRSNLYIGLKPLQALFGNNNKRVERIQEGEQKRNANRKLTYINLRRTAPKEKYKVRFFQKEEQRQAEADLSQQYHELLRTQRLDTTVRLLR
ncbi:AsmA-like C-terminal region-containing protein [Hymenobacter humi]|uniref:AsmA-like C-terminal region-containing protein n=1 Tax=Hymenobacter humi TaxID=1411620 RepID=A0ABW2U9Q8_9BACT